MTSTKTAQCSRSKRFKPQVISLFLSLGVVRLLFQGRNLESRKWRMVLVLWHVLPLQKPAANTHVYIFWSNPAVGANTDVRCAHPFYIHGALLKLGPINITVGKHRELIPCLVRLHAACLRVIRGCACKHKGSGGLPRCRSNSCVCVFMPAQTLRMGGLSLLKINIGATHSFLMLRGEGKGGV